MRLNTIKAGFASLCFLSMFGCTKDFKEINSNPTLVSSDVVQPGLLFTSAIKGAVFELPAQGLLADYAGYYKNPSSGNIFLERDWSNPYNNYYRNYLINMSEVIRLTAKDTIFRNQNSIARICRAMLFQQLTDSYGDIPYFDAVKSINEVVVQPKYDKQEDIYKDLLKEVKEATALLINASSQVSFGSADILLKGNVDAWRRFGNSLRLRMAMRVRYADAGLAAQHIQEVVGQPLITTNAQNVTLATLNDGNTANINAFYTRNSTQPNSMLVSFTTTDNLIRLNDPRLPLYARPANAADAGYRGVPLQLGPDQQGRYATDSVARMATSFLQQVYTIVVMNAAEVSFLRAEAALAGISTENANDLYRSGIQLAMS
ncbi:MAG: SusD/RagB family nutrient-binding outer membrane lipoprotein, partial [Sphingobacteriales bacterium]